MRIWCYDDHRLRLSGFYDRFTDIAHPHLIPIPILPSSSSSPYSSLSSSSSGGWWHFCWSLHSEVHTWRLAPRPPGTVSVTFSTTNIPQVFGFHQSFSKFPRILLLRRWNTSWASAIWTLIIIILGPYISIAVFSLIILSPLFLKTSKIANIYIRII